MFIDGQRKREVQDAKAHWSEMRWVKWDGDEPIICPVEGSTPEEVIEYWHVLSEAWTIGSGYIDDGRAIIIPRESGDQLVMVLGRIARPRQTADAPLKWEYQMGAECMGCMMFFEFNASPYFKALPERCPDCRGTSVEEVKRDGTPRKRKPSPVLDAVRSAQAALPGASDEQVIAAAVEALPVKASGRDTRKQDVKQALARLKGKR